MAYSSIVPTNGPVVPISLFPEAMQAGAAVGNATKTPVQALAEGVTKGIANYQEFQINQAKIDEIPLDMEIKRQTLLNEQARLELNQAQLEASKANQALKLEAERNDLEMKATVTRGKTEINNGLAKGDYESIFTSPNAQAALNEDKEYAKNTIGVMLGATNPDGSPKVQGAKRDQLMTQLDAMRKYEIDSRRAETDAKFREKLLEKYNADVEKVIDDPELAAAFGNLPLSEALSRVEIVPVGSRKKTEDGRVLPGLSDVDPIGDIGSYEVLRDGKATGQTITGKQAIENFNKLKRSHGQLFSSGQQEAPAPQRKEQADPNAPGGANNPYPIGFEWMGDAPKQEAGVPIVPIKGNGNIIEQRRADFNELAKKNPQGLPGGSLEEQLKQRNAEIRARVSKMNQPAVPQNQEWNFDTKVDAKIGVAPVPASVAAAAMTQAYFPKAKEAVFGALGKLIGLNTKVSKVDLNVPLTMDEGTWKRINTDPILAPEPAIIKGLVSTESAGRPDAVSPTGVRGYAQVTKAVAAQYGLNRDIPEENLLAGKKYLFDNLVVFNGNLKLALAAYNAGPGLMRQAVRETGSTDWTEIKKYLKTVLSDAKYREVENYPDKVISNSMHFIQDGRDIDKNFAQLLVENDIVS